TNPPAPVATGIAAATYSPGSMVPATTYYWQVVARNAAGSAAGPVWSFTTQVAPPTAPIAVTPANAAGNVTTTPSLAWTAAGATSYDVAFGATTPPPVIATGLAAATFAPAGPLSYATTYYWQVTAKNAGGSTTGAISSFTTIVAAPEAPTPTAPANGAGNVATGTSLSWSATGATSYDIAFGTTTPPPSVATGLTAATYTPTSLSNATTYFWQVTAKNAGGPTPDPRTAVQTRRA